jgi:membrane protein implicated in regulation of membrane protease activity
VNASELFSWYGVGYVAVFLVGLVLLLIGMLGLGGDGVDHDMDADGDGHVDHPLLDFLGIGRCPFSIVLMVWCFLYTLSGLAIVLILRMFYTPGLAVGVVAYPTAAVLSFLCTGLVARVISKLMPTNETYVESESEHIGLLGTATCGFDDGVGFVQVRDASGTVHEMKAINAEPTTPVKNGDAILVVDYEAAERTFKIQKAPAEVS